MAFSEKIKEKVKRRAHFKCCLCHLEWATEIHHIVPEEEDGPDTEENAAPLCARCHGLYGGNLDMRKYIRQSRDFWYDQCDRRSPPNIEMVREIHEYLCKKVVTKEDLDNALRPVYDAVLNRDLPTDKRIQQVSDVTTAISDVIVVGPRLRCPKCGHACKIISNACDNCGAPLLFDY